MQSFRQIGLKLLKIGAIQNQYPIVVYGVRVISDSESKNPWPLFPPKKTQEIIENYSSAQNNESKVFHEAAETQFMKFTKYMQFTKYMPFTKYMQFTKYMKFTE